MTIPEMPIPVTLTERAVEMVKIALSQEGFDTAYALRVGIVGGGCSGLQYMLDFTKEFSDYDMVYSQKDVKVVIDYFSASHLMNTVVNYVDSISESGFKFENPNVTRTCGCGMSFA